MRVAYHEDVDILSIIFRHETVDVSAEVIPGVVVDYDHEGGILAFEIFDAGKFTDFSEVLVFISQWGNEDRILDAKGGLSVRPRAANPIPAGD